MSISSSPNPPFLKHNNTNKTNKNHQVPFVLPSNFFPTHSMSIDINYKKNNKHNRTTDKILHQKTKKTHKNNQIINANKSQQELSKNLQQSFTKLKQQIKQLYQQSHLRQLSKHHYQNQFQQNHQKIKQVSAQTYTSKIEKQNTNITNTISTQQQHKQDHTSQSSSGFLQQEFDNNFDRILSHLPQQTESKIQKKFNYAKHTYDEVKQGQSFTQQSSSQINTHEKLLIQQNYYMRQQLIQFTQMIEQERHRVKRCKNKSKALRRQNQFLKNQIDNITLAHQSIINQFFTTSDDKYALSVKQEEYLQTIRKLTQNKEDLEIRLDNVSQECQQLYHSFQEFKNIKEKQIQEIIQEKDNQINVLVEQQEQRESQIQELKQLVLELQNQIKIRQNTQKIKQPFSLSYLDHEQNQSKNQKKSNLCLSLDEARTLKYIIQQKELIHSQEIGKILSEKQHLQKTLNQQIKTLTQKLKNVDFSPKKTSSDQSHSYQMKYQQRIIQLEERILYEKVQKQTALAEVAYLKSKCQQLQQEQQIDQLLQRCVNQLQLEKNQNAALRQELYKYQVMFKNIDQRKRFH